MGEALADSGERYGIHVEIRAVLHGRRAGNNDFSLGDVGSEPPHREGHGGVPSSVRETDNGEAHRAKSQWETEIPPVGGNGVWTGIGGYGNLYLQEKEHGDKFHYKYAYTRPVPGGGEAARSVGGEVVVVAGGDSPHMYLGGGGGGDTRGGRGVRQQRDRIMKRRG